MTIKRTERIDENTVYHETEDKRIIQTSHDLSRLLKANHFQRTEQSMRHTNEVFNHTARIYPPAVEKWCRERGITKDWYRMVFGSDKTLLREYLNDPENKIWRTRLGKI